IMKSDIIDEHGQFTRDVSKSFFLKLLNKFGSPESTHALKFQVMSKVASCIKVFHAIELLQTQGLDAVLDYYENMLKEVSHINSGS
ncbi:MAG: hypothetical protein R3339_05845, partial [Thermodesulfobacteriota bacterium]|nr:hypothetical protein [Thermodesulfobacteriota bacterium]